MSQEQMDKMEQTLISIERRLAAQEEQIKGALKRIDEQSALTESVHKLATSVELLTQKQTTIGEKVDLISKDVEDLKQKPVKKWDDIVKTVVTVLLTAGITFILARVGIK